MTATISGIVFNDLNSNGIFTTGEPGIENAFVVLVDTLGICSNLQTDINGNYSFTNIITSGNYTIFETVTTPNSCPPTVFVQPDNFNESTTPRQINITVTDANISENFTLSNNNFGHDNLSSIGCSPFAYQVQGTPTTLTKIDLVTGNTIDVGSLTPRSTFGGTGYNVIDNNLWGYNSVADTVGRIAENTSVTNLPPIPNLPLRNYNVGDVDSNGYLYLYITSGASFFVIDVNSNRGSFGRLVDPANSFLEQTTVPFGVSLSSAPNITDWAFNPQDNFLYSIGNSTGNILKFNAITGAVTSITPSPATSGVYGASFFDNNNNLYELEDSTGSIFKYALSDNPPTRTFFSQSVAVNTNDGARCATAPLYFADLSSIFKSVDKSFASCGDTISYTILLPNSGNITAFNVILKDTIPLGTVLINNSVFTNGIKQIGANPEFGITIPSIAPGAISTVTFSVNVKC